MFRYLRLKVVRIYRLFSYSGDEHRSLVSVCKGDKANNLDKDLEKKDNDETQRR